MDPSVDSIKCTWKLGDKPQDSPHIHDPPRNEPKKIYNDVLDAIGNTPMIRMNRIGKDDNISCQLLAKCEFMNMGGSVKDRIGKRMVLDAEKKGILKPGTKVVEATSGNTGIGLALATAVRGYECIVTMPEKMSAQKANVLKGLGAKIIRTPTQCGFDHPQSHISIAKNMQEKGQAIMLDQYINPSNPIAHYDALAEQIIYQCDGKIDALIVGVGTGGTITGIARKFKEKGLNTIIVGADPMGSILAMPQQLNKQAPPNKIQGIGYDFVPRVLDRKVIDHWVKTQDIPSFRYARQLMRKEGLLVGGSSGSVVQAAKQFIREKGWQNDATKRIVCVFSDSIRNYLTKHLSKQWCVQNGFLDHSQLKQQGHPWNGISIDQLKLSKIEAYQDLTVAQAKQLFEKGAKIIPLKAKGNIHSVIIPKKFLELVLLKKLSGTDSACKTKIADFALVPNTLDCAQLSKILQRHEAALVFKKDQKGQIQQLWVATPEDTFKLLK